MLRNACHCVPAVHFSLLWQLLSRGLGIIQRGLLLALARIEVGAAEEAAEKQRRYQPSTRADIHAVLYVACQHELREALVAKMRDEYGLQLAIDE